MALAARVDDDAAILLEERDTHGVLRLTLNRPAARNALSMALMADMIAALDRANGDTESRVVVIAGAGSGSARARSQGDAQRPERRGLCPHLRPLQRDDAKDRPPQAARHRRGARHRHRRRLSAGRELRPRCPAGDARFATSGINVGLFCSTPMVALSRAIGRKAALEMLLTGDFIDAATAKSLGLVNQSCRGRAARRHRALAARSPRNRRSASRSQGSLLPPDRNGLSAAYAYTRGDDQNMLAHDAEEGIDAFIQKRKPVWRDR